MGASLVQLVQDGTEGARIVFGAGGDAVGAGRLIERGAALYADGVAASAVGTLLTSDRPTVEVLLGAIARGAKLVSLPLPGRGSDLGDYASFVQAARAKHGVGEIVARDDIAELLAGLGLRTRGHSSLGVEPLAPPGDEFRLVQFTSGSTQRPKSVVLGDAALGANVSAILDSVRPEPGDVAVSWLPLSHDMGLVGMLVTSLAAMSPRWIGRGDIVLLDPADFLRRPALWLEALSFYRGTFTAAPNFGYRMASLRAPHDDLDLSPLRCAIVGGEIVRAETLTHFVDRFTPHGLRARALCPAYGLAELGLAATMTRPESDWRTRTIATAALADDKLDPPRPGQPTITLVASGEPLRQYEIRCGSGAEESGPQATSGAIAVRGPSVGADGTTGASFADADGWLHTGDTGFADDGWLFVCGRNDDYLVAHGRNLYAPAIDAAIGTVEGIRPGRTTAVALPNGAWVVVAEPANPAYARGRLHEDVRRAAVKVASASPDDVVIVERGSLPLTASGKIQRNEVRKRLLRGDFGDPHRRTWQHF